MTPGRKAVFFRTLSSVFATGISPLQAFAHLEGGWLSGPARRFCEDARRRSAAGRPFADACAAHPRVFDPLEIAMIRMGEESGKLPEVLDHLAGLLEHRSRVRTNLAVGLLYPVLLLHAAILIPPAPLFFAEGLAAYLWRALVPLAAVYGIAAAAFAVSLAGRRVEALGRGVRLFLWHAPFVNHFVRPLEWSQILFALGSMLRAGIPVTRGVAALREMRFSAPLEAMERRLKAGSTIAEAASAIPSIPGIAVQLIHAGEQSGRLDENLEKASQLLLEQFEARMRYFAVIFPILAYLAIAGYIVYYILTFYLKLFSGYGSVLDR